MRLAHKTAIVTGAGSGFGEGIAKTFAQQGARVVIADMNATGGQRVAQEIRDAGGQAHFIEVNVAQDASVAALLRNPLEQYDGRLLYTPEAADE